MMLRFVLGPDGKVYFDLSGQVEGQAVELPAERQVFEQELLTLSEKLGGEVADDLADVVEKTLRKHLSQTLNLAKKAGVLCLGFDQTQEAVRKGQARVLVLAEDAGTDVKKRVEALKQGGYNTLVWGTNKDLATTFGLAACALVCLKESPVTTKVADLVKKLQAFQGQ